jgi:hypothetical protein
MFNPLGSPKDKSNSIKGSSMKHLDALLSALTCLSGLLNFSWAEKGITALSVCYQRICRALFEDPAGTISSLKTAHKAYFEWIRGGPDPTTIVDPVLDPSPDMFGYSVLTSLLESLVQLRPSIKNGKDSIALLAYDRIALALLSCHRLIVTKPVYDFSSISEPGDSPFHRDLAHWKAATNPKKKQTVWNFVPAVGPTFTDLKDFLKTLEFTESAFRDMYRDECRNLKHFIPSSAGPNGKSGWTAYSDGVAILQSYEVFKYFRELMKASGLQRFYADFVNTIQVKGHDMVLSAVVNLGKIHTFAE